ncbi:MAG TPA: helix-hairpin-helix domain-containing protein [Gemmatimonadales bacterium]|nr:helix-hairpin-helix domain-containing protein [Gemmatimonadales bacterium]
MSPEYRSVLLLAGLAVVGQAVRCALLDPGEAPGAVTVLGDADSASPLAHRDSSRLAGQPLKEGELIDLDRATAAEIARLPGIGPDLARRIVDDRNAHGSFGSVAALDALPGVGPGLLKRLDGHVSFSGPIRPGSAAVAGPGSTAPVGLNSATANDLATLPGLGPGRAAAIVAYRQSHGPFASIEALTAVPGIGPATVVKLRPFLEIR